MQRTQTKKLEARLSVITEQVQKLDTTMTYKKESKKRIFGQLKGKLTIAEDFNDESDEINEMFYGK